MPEPGDRFIADEVQCGGLWGCARRGVDADPVTLVNALRARRVLISATGRAGDTRTIRPPFVFSAGDAALLLEALDATLAEAGTMARSG